MDNQRPHVRMYIFPEFKKMPKFEILRPYNFFLFNDNHVIFCITYLHLYGFPKQSFLTTWLIIEKKYRPSKFWFLPKLAKNQ